MELTFNSIQKMEDALDEFLYNKHLTEQELVDSRLVSTVEVARTFQEAYGENPTKGLLVLICDKYQPASVTLGLDRLGIPTASLQTRVNFLWDLSQEQSRKRADYIRDHKYIKKHREEK